MSAETGGDSNESKNESGTDVAYLMPGKEPHLHNQAMSCHDASFWEDAKVHELSQIIKLGAYKLIPLPPCHSAIRSKWVYKVKRDNIGDIVLVLLPRDTLSTLELTFLRHMHLLPGSNQSEFSSLLQYH